MVKEVEVVIKKMKVVELAKEEVVKMEVAELV